LGSRIEVYQADNPGVRGTADGDQLTEVLVERDENALFVFRARKDLLVSRILAPGPSPYDIVSTVGQDRKLPAQTHVSKRSFT